ncbi:MAG: alpha/beta hydrolase [Bdellovibrionaceae bacterium]|nr:alpha/beta hydrolase [Pseudobdellovibrionaceae bacterium]
MIHWLAAFLLFTAFLSKGTDLSSLDPGVQRFLKEHESRQQFLDKTLFNHYYQSPHIKETAIVFLPGMGEPALKYYDLTTDITKDGTFYLWDHIGQGSSYHLLPQERIKVHIDTFDTHIKTFKKFLLELKKKHKRILVIGHSMGGHIALRVITENPKLVDKLILSAPLMEINSTWVPIHLVAWLANVFPADYYPPFYTWFKKSSERGNYTTTSKEKTEVYRKTYSLFPDIKSSGATLGWIRAAQNYIKELNASDLEKITTPILLLQAEHEYLVSNPAQTTTCNRIASCTLQVIKGSRHELLFETTGPRNEALKWINNFL